MMNTDEDVEFIPVDGGLFLFVMKADGVKSRLQFVDRAYLLKINLKSGQALGRGKSGSQMSWNVEHPEDDALPLPVVSNDTP